MPDYQVKNFIKTTLEKYNNLKKESNILLLKMNKLKADSSTDIITMNKLRSVDFDLKIMESEIKNLRNLYTKSASDIEPAYKEAMRINGIFETLEFVLQKNKKIIESLETNKK
jgi:vacuolar-type H+-ATPase subunit I/STV1